jgi:hypothetical protein
MIPFVFIYLLGSVVSGHSGPPLARSRSQQISPSAQSPSSPDDDPMQTAGKIAKISLDWMSGRLSTPGTSAEIREVKRSTSGGQLTVSYHVFVKGVPADQTYTFVTWPINAKGPVEQIRGLTLLPNGMVICAGRKPEQCGDDNRKDDPVDFIFAPAKGEVFRLALVSDDGTAKIFFAIVPDPVMRKGKVAASKPSSSCPGSRWR